jgi:ElaB/YqjD/DUF883 family membrane-anchored ribosome-binding protein
MYSQKSSQPSPSDRDEITQQPSRKRESIARVAAGSKQEGKNIMNTELSTEKLIKDLRTVTRDAEALVEATAGDVSDRAREARQRLTEALDSAKASCETLKEKATAGAKAADKVIRDNPYQSLGIAFGVGLLIGVLANRGK